MKKKKNNNWFLIVIISTFILSLLFSYISNTAITNLDIIPSIIILFVVIIIGIFFDLVGVSVTIAEEESFHAKSSKKIKGAKTAIKLIKNSAKVSNFCADVIGDICGVLSGAISAIIALNITQKYGCNTSIQFLLSAIVSSLTVGGKALTKEFAKKNADNILFSICRIIER